MPWNATLFDFNGVLVDDEELHREGFNAVLAPHGLAIDRDVYEQRYLGFDDRGAFEAIFADAQKSMGPSEIDALIVAKAQYYERRAHEGALVFFDGARAMVELAASKGPVAIVSGALRREIELALRLLDVHSLVRFIIAAEDVERCKPDPAGYLAAIDRLAREHERFDQGSVRVIEDSLAGIEAARAAGLEVWAVAHSYDEATLSHAQPTKTYASLRALYEAERRARDER
jgi:HAD superfamily hydrolase (TIGR01509 family)